MSLFNRKQRRAAAIAARTSKQIQQEYQQACAAVGDRSFQLSILKAQVEDLYKRMHALGSEMNQALAKEQKEAEAAKIQEAKDASQSKA